LAIKKKERNCLKNIKDPSSSVIVDVIDDIRFTIGYS